MEFLAVTKVFEGFSRCQMMESYVQIAKRHQTRKMEPTGLEPGFLMGLVEVRLENEGEVWPASKKSPNT